jgi:antitoxin-like ribbon-helix-helix protein
MKKKLPVGRAAKTKPAAETRDTAAPSRQGKKAISGFFDPAVSKQLKMIGLERDDESLQELLREALNDLFVKYKKAPIA